MSRRWARRLAWGLALVATTGCRTPLSSLDATLQSITATPIDPTVITPASGSKPATDATPPPLKGTGSVDDRLQVPPGLPGADAEPIRIPAGNREERAAAVRKLYEQPLPAPASDTAKVTGKALNLSELQALAAANSPALRQAAAEVDAARGSLIQAGLLPNPNVGYEADTIGSGRTAGQQGGYVEQLIKTGGKVKLAQAAAAIDVANAEVGLRRAQVELASRVRAAYFSVLVAQETINSTKALVSLTEEVYRLQVDRVVKANVDAPYEPMQLRVLAMQARTNLIAAQNRYRSAWKQLAATLNQPDLPPTELVGRPDMPLPVHQFDTARARMLASHTDLAKAHNDVLKAQYQLRLAEVTPVPDVFTRAAVQRDYTTPPFHTSVNVQIGVPIPFFDRNQGGIRTAQAQLARAIEETPRVRNDLDRQLADAYERYSSAKAQVEYYRTSVLPDQVRAYRGVYGRYQVDPEKITVYDIVNAQQTLATAVQTYLSALSQAWTAAVDLANLMQTDDLFGKEP